jgi:hypothetical protein
MTPAQAMAYSRKGKKIKGIPITDDRDGIEISRRHRLKMLAEARAMMGK